ncbi:MAG TPA: Uma2 family endonuclease [Urbifossiella sp.]|nr:Uma2 family endonuclease [Urbifossiella sp.]
MSTATLQPPATNRRTGPRLLTCADLAVLPTTLPSGDVRYELDNGRLVIMPPPGDIHGRTQYKVGRYLDTHAEELGLGEGWVEVGIVLRRDPDRVVGADAAFVLKASQPVRVTTEGWLETIPEIVVEIRSKNDTTPEVLAKRDEYFDAGVRVVWVLDPDDRTVVVHAPPAAPVVFATADTLTSPLLPGFAVPVALLFPVRAAPG